MRKIKKTTGKQVPFFPADREYLFLKKELHESLDSVGTSGQIVLGPKVKLFESELAKKVNRKFAVSCASGTDAITLALMAANIGRGDEVIMPANSYPSVFGVALSGATPVLADVDYATGSITLDQIKSEITEKTKAVLAVHLYGLPVEIEKIADFCKKNKLILIEDCAQATGSRFNKKPVGSFGDMAIFSFYPTKNLGAIGDGGAVVTNNEKLCNELHALRMYGEKERYNSESLGMNSRLDELQAAFLLNKLKYLDSWISRRRELADIYYKLLSNLANLELIPILDGLENSFHLFPIRTNKRDELKKWLDDNQIQSGIHYPKSIHHTKTFGNLGNKNFPNSEKWNSTTLSLPMHPFLSDEEVIFVANKVLEFFKK